VRLIEEQGLEEFDRRIRENRPSRVTFPRMT
jgi:hypothetical protein